MSGRFEAYSLPLSSEDSKQTFFQITLIIDPVLAVDFDSHVYIELLNEAGTSHFDITLIEKVYLPDGDGNEEITEKEGVSGGVVVGVTLAIIILIVVVACVTVYYMKKQQLGCFAQSG